MPSNNEPRNRNAREFGIRPDSSASQTERLREALAGTPDGGVLRFEPGVYHFHPEGASGLFCATSNNQAGQKRVAFHLRRRTGLTIDGGGAVFLFHGEILPFFAERCADLRIRDVVIDWERPFFSQGEVVAAGEDFVDVRVDRDRFPCEIADGRLLFHGEGWSRGFNEGIFEIEARRLRPAFLSGDNCGGRLRESEGSRDLGGSVFRLPGHFPRPATPGNFLVLRHFPRRVPAVFVDRSRGVELRGLTVRHCAGTGILGQFSEDLAVRRCEVVPADGRVFSTTADATHFVCCRGEVRLEDCRFRGQLDDATNVHGIHHPVREARDGRLRVGLGHFEQDCTRLGEPGDRVFLREAGSLVVRAACRIASVEDEEGSFMVRTVDGLPGGVGPGMVLENVDAAPRVSVTGCEAVDNRARGLLVSSPRPAIVRGNRLGPAGAAVKISGDAGYWFEAGAVNDVLLEDNDFDDCCYGPPAWGRAVIDIDPEIADPWNRERSYHRNIRIVGNRFDTSGRGLVYARSVHGLVFRGNRIGPPSGAYPPTDRMAARVTLDACEDFATDGNEFPADDGFPFVEENREPTDRHEVTHQPHLDDSSAASAFGATEAVGPVDRS